jgi:hypothetical protein
VHAAYTVFSSLQAEPISLLGGQESIGHESPAIAVRIRNTMSTVLILLVLFVVVPILIGHIIHFGTAAGESRARDAQPEPNEVKARIAPDGRSEVRL